MRYTLYPADQKYDLFHIKQSHISYVDLWDSLIFRFENRYGLLPFPDASWADPEIPGLLFLQKRLHTATFFRKKSIRSYEQAPYKICRAQRMLLE